MLPKAVEHHVSRVPAVRPFHNGLEAITCVGFKWLCGPYGTGFCWMQDVEEYDVLNVARQHTVQHPATFDTSAVES